jgi:hypothetical protein
MTRTTQKLKKLLPTPVWDTARFTWYGLQRAAQWPSATFHPWRRASIHRLTRYKNAHRGQRCFIIGNGPSLKQTDLSLLRDEFTFGMNRIYLAFPELGFTTRYYLSINSLVIEQCAAEIRALPIPKFLSWHSKDVYRRGIAANSSPLEKDTIFLHTTYTGPKFAQDARGRLWEGATVTYVALQLAFHMGFEKVILIGVDHRFSSQGRPNTTVVSQGDDADHFHTNYFGKGFRWQLPDLETSERAYRMALAAFNRAGRQVVDATIGGNLSVFPKADYYSLF